jgi:hypothetical protein
MVNIQSARTVVRFDHLLDVGYQAARDVGCAFKRFIRRYLWRHLSAH